jgi:hypothetical protein
MEKEWVKEAMKAFEHREMEERENRDTGVIFTNFGWHFSRDEGSSPGENCQARVAKPKYALRDQSWELQTTLQSMAEAQELRTPITILAADD